MADYRKPAPEVSWETIDKAFAASKPHKKIPLGYWLKGIAAAAILLLAAGVGIRIVNRPEETPEQQIAPIRNEQITITSDEQFQPDLTGSPTVELQPTAMAKTAGYVSRKSTLKSSPTASEPGTITDNTDNIPESDIVKEETSKQKTEEPSIVPEGQTVLVFDTPDIIVSTKRSKQQSGRLMAQAYMSNAMADSRLYESHRQLEYYNDIIIKQLEVDMSYAGLSDPGHSDSVFHINPVKQYILVYDTIKKVNIIQTDRSIRHHQPVKLGFSLSYQMHDRWTLESGLQYALLVSDITIIHDGETEVTQQKLHYIGIPLNAGYQFWTNHKGGIYVTAGGTVEKQLNGRDWQFSLNGSAGAQYMFTDRLSLYAEPGVGYYIPNNSNLSTIYKDHPWNFNLTFGLRFHL
ncbi:MAG: porin family protein [Bacteroidaceae bacterium]|nr:porin family protein [Bacteroidaceae bacterium]